MPRSREISRRTWRGLKAPSWPPGKGSCRCRTACSFEKLADLFAWLEFHEESRGAFCLIGVRKMARGRYMRWESLPKGSMMHSMPTAMATWMT